MTTKDRLDRHDRQIAAITKLLQTGMRMLVKTQEEQTALRKEVRELTSDVRGLAAMQKRTEATLQAFINTMKRGGNGHSKKPIGLS
jgi:predicted  nucleic acid-binding Zn-ribbon protein